VPSTVTLLRDNQSLIQLSHSMTYSEDAKGLHGFYVYFSVYLTSNNVLKHMCSRVGIEVDSCSCSF